MAGKGSSDEAAGDAREKGSDEEDSGKTGSSNGKEVAAQLKDSGRAMDGSYTEASQGMTM